MKRSLYFIFALALCSLFVSCTDKKGEATQENADTLSVADNDTTIYGTCGKNTTMHNLELLADNGTTLSFLVNTTVDEEGNTLENAVVGGLLAGDRLAVISQVVDGDTTATKVLNLTTLKGKWVSLDRSFEILDDGDVLSAIQSEKNPYTTWRIHNGHLLLGCDTFDILTLGADTLEIESRKGIYVYKRQY